MYKMVRILFLFLLGLFFLSSCKDESDFVPDVSGIETDFSFVRFDKELFQVDTLNYDSELRELIQKYPEFSDIYFKYVLEISKEKDTAEFLSEINTEILKDPGFRSIHDSIQLIYSDDNFLKTEFSKSYKFLKYYFPDYTPPNIYTFQSDFAFQKFIFEDAQRDGIGIGLDMYLGSNFPYKALDPQNPSFSDYLTRSFNKDHIVKHAIELISEDFIGEAAGVRMIDYMIHNGLKLYLLKKILPETHDTIIFEFTHDQLEWCKENELEMWAFFLDEGLIYETSLAKINKYINPSPTSPGMPSRAPGRTANYLGYKIIKSYVNKNPNTQLTDLIGITDTQKFLEKSGFKPKRKKR